MPIVISERLLKDRASIPESSVLLIGQNLQDSTKTFSHTSIESPSMIHNQLRTNLLDKDELDEILTQDTDCYNNFRFLGKA